MDDADRGMLPGDERLRRQVGELLREFRGGRGWNQTAAAGKLNVDKSHLSRLESGTASELTLPLARAIARAWALTPDEEGRLWESLGVDIEGFARRRQAGGDERASRLVAGPPAQPSGYVEDVDRLAHLLRLCRDAGLVLVHGLPGSGKTTLVGEVARAMRADGTDPAARSVWLDVRRVDGVGILSLCAAILHGLGERPDDVTGLSAEGAIPVALDALGPARTVLVIDGVDAALPPDGGIPGEVDMLLGGLAACPAATTVIVSRVRVDSPHIKRHRALHMTGLSEGAGESFAVGLLPQAPEGAARLFARRVAHHPLAMEILARRASTARGMRVEDLVVDDRMWTSAVRRASAVILQDMAVPPEHAHALRFLSVLRSPLDPDVARRARVAGVEAPVGDALSSLEGAGLAYFEGGWIAHPVAAAHARDRLGDRLGAESIADHVAAARMYEAAAARAESGELDAAARQRWALEAAHHFVVAGDLTHAGDVLGTYRPTSGHIAGGRAADVYALWATIKAAGAGSGGRAGDTMASPALARLPDVVVQDLSIAALCAGDRDTAHAIMAGLRVGRSGVTERLIRACIHYAGAMCHHGAADVALGLVQAARDQLIVVHDRAFAPLHIELLLMEAKIVFERCDATGAMGLCDEAIAECARYRDETRSPDSGDAARNVVGRLLSRFIGGARTTPRGGVDTDADAHVIAELAAYARCMRAVSLFALGRHDDAYGSFDDTLKMAADAGGIGSDIYLFTLDHDVACAMAGREWGRALTTLRRRLSAMGERREREEDERARGAACTPYPDAGRPSYLDVERTYYIETLLSAGDYAVAEREARDVREQLLSYETAMARRIYAYRGVDRRQRWGLTVERDKATSARAMVQEVLARALLWGGRVQDAARMHDDTMRALRASEPDQVVTDETLRRLVRAWDSAQERAAQDLPPMRDPESRLILPRRFFGNPALVCRAKMDARYGRTHKHVYRRADGDQDSYRHADRDHNPYFHADGDQEPDANEHSDRNGDTNGDGDHNPVANGHQHEHTCTDGHQHEHTCTDGHQHADARGHMSHAQRDDGHRLPDL